MKSSLSLLLAGTTGLLSQQVAAETTVPQENGHDCPAFCDALDKKMFDFNECFAHDPSKSESIVAGVQLKTGENEYVNLSFEEIKNISISSTIDVITDDKGDIYYQCIPFLRYDFNSKPLEKLDFSNAYKLRIKTDWASQTLKSAENNKIRMMFTFVESSDKTHHGLIESRMQGVYIGGGVEANSIY
eukprot:Pgem_evm1s15964